MINVNLPGFAMVEEETKMLYENEAETSKIIPISCRSDVKINLGKTFCRKKE